MSAAIRLIVGLANPGKDYDKTRHNAGAWFIDQILASENAGLRNESKFHGKHASITLDNTQCQLLIPTTFMNRSGLAVRAVSQYYKIPPDGILIAHDDIDLPVGTIKIKLDGGDGGHNGLKDIISHLNTRAFYRLRIGVGRPRHSKDVVDYVLEPPSKADRTKIETGLELAVAVLPLLIAGKIQQAMQQLHTEKNVE